MKRIIVLILVVSSILLIYNPNLAPHPLIKTPATKIHQLIFPDGDNESSAVNIEGAQQKIAWVWGKLVEKFLIFAKNTKLPTQITGLPEEIVVQDVIDNLTKEVKKLPERQVQKVKTQFCQDVINEATSSVAGIKDEAN